MDRNRRYELGIEVLKRVGGADYDAPLKALEPIAPDLARFTVEFGYGDVLSRPGLDLKTRQIVTVAALAAMGNAAQQLRYHIDGSLNVGWEPDQIVEAILLSTVYAGFPAALNGVFTAAAVFERRGVMPVLAASSDSTDRSERGLAALKTVSGGAGAEVVEGVSQIAPDLGRLSSSFHTARSFRAPASTIAPKNLPRWEC
jgi:4-carboxymuconolactone decarboxylase